MTTNEEVVREAYRLAEGDVLDAPAFRALFTEDGTFHDVPNTQTFRGDEIPAALTGFAAVFPDIHRELGELHVLGDVVAVELRIQGTHLGAFPTPVGAVPPTGNRIDMPAADLWYLRDGKIERFHCYNATHVMLTQIGAAPDFAAAIALAAETAHDSTLSPAGRYDNPGTVR